LGGKVVKAAGNAQNRGIFVFGQKMVEEDALIMREAWHFFILSKVRQRKKGVTKKTNNRGNSVFCQGEERPLAEFSQKGEQAIRATLPWRI